MNREERAAALERALELVGKEKEPCATCGRPQGPVVYGHHAHSAYSAAKAVGIDPQHVYRAIRRRSQAPASPTSPASPPPKD